MIWIIIITTLMVTKIERDRERLKIANAPVGVEASSLNLWAVSMQQNGENLIGLRFLHPEVLKTKLRIEVRFAYS